MPDEIMPRDRAELLWDAIINHTIEAVDAIRDRPELIAAAIAAGLPDMLGDPRDRYELFLKAIAGAQGGGSSDDFIIKNMAGRNNKWYLPSMLGTIGGGKTLIVEIYDPTPSVSKGSIISVANVATDLPMSGSNTAFHIYHSYTEGSVDAIRFEGNPIPGASYNVDSSEPIVIEINKTNIKVNDNIVMTTPTYVVNLYANVLGSEIGSRFNGIYKTISFK